MKERRRFILIDRQGMILMNSLALLSVLMVASVGAVIMLQNDFHLLGNLRRATAAFYISVAGVEWAKSELASANGFPQSPSKHSKPVSPGHFVVTFLSSTVTGPLAARFTVHSVGVSGAAENAVQAQLTKSYDLADAALVVRGNGAGISLGAGTFISGVDHDPNSGQGSGIRSRNSVSVVNDAQRTMVMDALGNPPRQGILDESAGMPAITLSELLPANLVAQLADNLCALATVSVHSIPAGAGLTIENQTWGNLAAPQVHCIEGSLGSGDVATMAGSVTGAGILVIKNADLLLSGSFRWQGLVLISGTDISFRTTGSGANEVVGAIIVNESGTPVEGRKFLNFEGPTRILFSRQALARGASLVPAAMANIAYESLPSLISQDYWRSVTP